MLGTQLIRFPQQHAIDFSQQRFDIVRVYLRH